MNTDSKLKLNAKLLEEKLKRNWGTTQFATYLQMSEDEFRKILEDTFEGPAGENYRRRLKKNDKRIEQQLRRRAVSVKTPEEKSGKAVEETVQEERTEFVDSSKAETKGHISKIQEQINKLQKVEIFVEKGRIEIVPADYEIPDGWKELRSDWLDDERFESLTLIELAILAKAVLLAKAISADGRKSTFVFESDLMQELFSEISK